MTQEDVRREEGGWAMYRPLQRRDGWGSSELSKQADGAQNRILERIEDDLHAIYIRGSGVLRWLEDTLFDHFLQR